jgi:lipopolysaccharide assembly outer membrane protein LptD (OstA)
MSVVLALSLTAPALAQVSVPADHGPITLTADHIEYNQQTGNVVADGHVVATRGSTTITADHLTGNLKSGGVEATGRVTLTQPGRTTTGESLHYNYLTRVGAMSQAVVKSGPWTLKGQTVTTAGGRGDLLAASATPCDPAHPAFLVKAKKVVVVPGDYLKAYDAVLYVYGVPVFYVPVFTTSLKPGRNVVSSAPTAGYDNFNGAWIQYTQYIPLGDWQSQIRALLGTRSGLSGEAIFDRRFTDYLLDFHFGRTVTFDQNGNEFNLDQDTVEADLYTHRIDRLPVAYSAAVQTGHFLEAETGVSAFRTDGVFTLTSDTLHLSPSLTASAGGYYRYDTYSTGDVRNILSASAAMTQTLNKVSSVALSYYFATVNGATPFAFDVISPDSVASLSYSYYPGRGLFQSGTISASYDFLAQQTSAGLNLAFSISPTLQFGSAVQYNLTTQQFTEIDYSVNAICDCVALGVVYRTFPTSPASNQWFITLGITSLPGIATKMTIGGPP